MTQSITTPCKSCGASLEYAPGTLVLKCPYCGHEEAIAPPKQNTLVELDINQFVSQADTSATLERDSVLRCNGCGAEYSMPATKQAGSCPFCGSNVVVPTDAKRMIPPGGVLPFRIDARVARDAYRKWIGSRFWAPNDLKRRAEQQSTLNGMYVPYWTYDSDTVTDYHGMRGEDYWEQESYTDSNGNRQSRSVRKTRWYPASGQVEVDFDDVLVLATESVPRKYTEHMQSWHLEELVSYQDQYLSGYQAMRYDVDLRTGFQRAEDLMKPRIESAIRSDIGGDRQQIHGYEIHHYEVTFKHVLLPIYSGAYRYSKRIWRFFINGQTGQVAGEAPVSWWKVTLAVLLGLIIVGTIAYFYFKSESGQGGSPSSTPVFEWEMR